MKAPAQIREFEWRWVLPILFVCLLNFWFPVGYVGGGTDDDRYLAGALCWVQSGPCLPVNHWEGRWPLIGPLALTIGAFGLNRVAVGIPSFLASLACIILIKKLGDRIDPKIGTAAALIFAAVPAFVFQVFTATVEAFELVFILAAMLAVLSRKHVVAGLFLALAFQTRETSIAALLPAAFLLRKDFRGLLVLGSTFLAVLLIEFLFFYLQTDSPIYRRMLSVGHIAIPSSELQASVSGRPFFNFELLKHWKYEPGIHLHWFVDGFANLFANVKTAFLYALTPLLLATNWRRLDPYERRAAVFLVTSASLYTAVLIYVLAIDPKSRVMFVPLAALALASAIVLVRAWNLVLAVLVATVTVLIALTAASQPRQLRYERAAEQFVAKHPGQVETAQPGYFGLSHLRNLPPAGSGKGFLLTLKNNPCATPSSDDVVDLSQLELRDEMRANALARGIGNRWSICLFEYVDSAQTIRPPARMGPGIRIRNGSIVD